MKRALTTLAALGLLVPAIGNAGYRELDEAWSEYRPPALYDAAVAGPGAAAPVEPAPAREPLAEAGAGWRAALQDAEPAVEPFFTPPPERLAAQAGAVADPASAAAALGGGFDLATLETLVWLRNPGVEAAANTVQAARQRYDQAGNLDAILRRYQAFTEGVMPGVGPMKGGAMPQMGYPYPDMAALKGQVVTQEVAVAREGLEIARRDALTSAREVYWNLGFLGEALRLTGEMERLLGDLLAVATTRYEAGKATFQDVVKVQIRLDTLVEERHTLEQQRRTALTALRRVLDLPADAVLGQPALAEPGEKVPALETLYPLAAVRRQELRQLDAKIAKLERMVAMGELRVHADPTTNLSLYPDAAITQVGTGRMAEPFAVTTAAATGAATPIAVGYGSGEAYLRETREKLAALRARRREVAAMVQLQVRQGWFALDRAVRERALYRNSVVELSETALDVSTRGYETGRVMFADVIASYTDWLQAHLGAERRRADTGVARAGLAAAVGVDLEDSEQ